MLQERLACRHRGSVSGLTVACATDGNHGRSVAWECAATAGLIAAALDPVLREALGLGPVRG